MSSVLLFSSRTDWHRHPNTLAQLLEARLRRGEPIIDLTVSNPTEAGFDYPARDILEALSQPASLQYTPHPFGLLAAREAVAAYYASRTISCTASQIVLTASTSEAYAWLFMLLCEAGELVVVPSPSYPLFEYLARMHHVQVRSYRLLYDGEWHIDVDSLRRAVSPSTKAIVVVSPHNPTGMFLKREELAELTAIAARHGLALIVDEVFSEYAFAADERRMTGAVQEHHVLTFTLNGISKLCGMPQLKLGWIVVGGPEPQQQEALRRLEIIADTFLSVNTPVQVALPQLMKAGERVRGQIHERVRMNYQLLTKAVPAGSPVSVLRTEGGWYAVLRMPRTRSDEEWAIRLLDGSGVYVFPGYFFDFAESGFLVVSLLTNPDVLQKGIEEVIQVAQRA
jgi:hypothetical protein